MIFSASPWLLLIALPGFWLAYALYFSGPSLSKRWRVGLALMTGAAWALLAWWIVQPHWKLDPDMYHPPVVVLAVDESPSYAALGAREAARDPGNATSVAAARTHYEALGFEVREAGFQGDPLNPVRAFDSAPPPNVQAILLWSDGRFGDRSDAARPFEDAPASVYPVLGGQSDEPQGEHVTVDLKGATREGEVTVEWRGAKSAVLELWKDRVVWTQKLSHPESFSPGSLARQTLSLPPEIHQRLSEAPNARWFALVRSVSGRHIASNDTIAIRFTGAGRHREVLLKPLISLDERALVDALTTDTSEVVAVFPRDLRHDPGDLLWARAGAARVSFDGPRIEYHLPDADAAGRVFDADARVGWAEAGSAHLPLEVLRLADLGVRNFEGLRLRAPDSALEALAWAERDGRRGLLLWRARRPANAAHAVYGIAVPPLWRTRFNAAADAASPGSPQALQAHWLRGAAAWARQRVATDSSVRASLRAQSMQAGAGEMARLGADEEALERRAAATQGYVIKSVTNKKDVNRVSRDSSDSLVSRVWPTLPGGQTRETRYQAISLAPAWLMLLLILALLGGVWVLRKRLQVD